MLGKYEAGIASVATRAITRAGKRDGTACLLAYEQDAGGLILGLGFSDGPGQPFTPVDLSEEEFGVMDTILSEWKGLNQGTLPWIDLVVVVQVSPKLAGVKIGASTLPRSLLKDPQRAEGRRMAHAEPLTTQMAHVAPMALPHSGRGR